MPEQDAALRERPASPPEKTALQISEQLASRIGSHKYDMWFGHTRFRVDGRHVEVATDSQFVANWIDAHFSTDLHGVARQALGDDVRIDVRVSPDLFGRREDDERRSSPETHHGRTNGATPRHRRSAGTAREPGERRPTRRLEDFVIGPCNRLAYAAACRMTDGRDAHLISPLFIHGECGVGKTHLLQGIGTRLSDLRHGSRTRYVTGEQFTNEYIAAVRNGSLETFRGRIRKLELLIIDDVHFLANKVRTQSEFLHTLDAIDLTGARLVLASDEHPRQIRKFSQALISRFLSGMVVRIERPTHETRVKLIRKLAAGRGLRLSDAAVEAIASRCLGSVRELEGAVTKLEALQTLRNGLQAKPDPAAPAAAAEPPEVGLVLVNQLFQDQDWLPATPVKIATIIDAVCERLGIARADLMGNGRHRRIVLGRELVAYLGRDLTTQSFPEIARALGRTYHSTVHSAATRLRRQIERGEQVQLGTGERRIDLRELVDELRHAVRRATVRA